VAADSIRTSKPERNRKPEKEKRETERTTKEKIAEGVANKTIRCWACSEKGHVMESCTTSSKEDKEKMVHKPPNRYAKKTEAGGKAVVTFAETDTSGAGEYTDDEEEPVGSDVAVLTYGRTALTTLFEDESVLTYQDVRVLLGQFSKNTILLNNQAGDDIFRDSHLGTGLREANQPLTISGVFEGNGGKRIKMEMDFLEDFTVYQHNKSVANILSQAKAVDRGDDYDYNKTTDEHVLGPWINGKYGPTYRFHRLLDSNGNPSSHYGCDMVATRDAWLREQMDPGPTASRAMVESVAENRKHYHKKELEKAGRAKYLNEAMGFPTAKTQAHMVRNTVKGSTVTPLDIANAQKIYGRESVQN
jgi:hypothetical protein